MSFLRNSSDPQLSTIFPTFIIPSIPFRRKSRASSSGESIASVKSALSASSVSTTSSNPFSRCPTPVPLPIRDHEIRPPTDKFLSGHNSHIHCAKCSTDLCLTSQIISKGFTGRHGRAYLVQSASALAQGIHASNATASVLPNTYLGKPVPRNLVTGQHTVSDVSCAICGSLLGWKYVEACETSQKYKVGKFILETKKIRVGVSWEGDEDRVDDSGYDEIVPVPLSELKRLKDDSNGVLEAMEFDSQDEDECEDLFAGVWSPQLASKRRQRRKERMSRRVTKITVRPNQSQDSFT